MKNLFLCCFVFTCLEGMAADAGKGEGGGVASYGGQRGRADFGTPHKYKTMFAKADFLMREMPEYSADRVHAFESPEVMADMDTAYREHQEQLDKDYANEKQRWWGTRAHFFPKKMFENDAKHHKRLYHKMLDELSVSFPTQVAEEERMMGKREEDLPPRRTP